MCFVAFWLLLDAVLLIADDVFGRLLLPLCWKLLTGCKIPSAFSTVVCYQWVEPGSFVCTVNEIEITSFRSTFRFSSYDRWYMYTYSVLSTRHLCTKYSHT